jgi:ferritin-like metal-binding protein YciE
MSVATMQELLVDELKDLYSAGKPDCASASEAGQAASTPELQEALSSHLEETKG